MTGPKLFLRASRLVKSKRFHKKNLRVRMRVSVDLCLDLVSKVKKMMAERLDTGDVSIEMLSKEIGMSPFHLIRTFKKVTGYSPIAYYKKLRAQAIAVSEFKNPQKKVIDLAFDLNFKSLSSFYATKKYLGSGGGTGQQSAIVKLPDREFIVGTVSKDELS